MVVFVMLGRYPKTPKALHEFSILYLTHMYMIYMIIHLCVYIPWIFKQYITAETFAGGMFQ